MGKLNNARTINPQDFSEDFQSDAEKLSYILTPFMQEVVDMSNKNIDFENLNQNFLSIAIEVDTNGKPAQVNKINVGKVNPLGIQVIKATNITNAANLSNQAPFVYFTPNGTNLVTIDKIVGLIPFNKYQLNIIIY